MKTEKNNPFVNGFQGKLVTNNFTIKKFQISEEFVGYFIRELIGEVDGLSGFHFQGVNDENYCLPNHAMLRKAVMSNGIGWYKIIYKGEKDKRGGKKIQIYEIYFGGE